MTGTEMKNVVLCVLVSVVVLFAVYQYNPTLFGFMGYEGFADAASAMNATPSTPPAKGPDSSVMNMAQMLGSAAAGANSSLAGATDSKNKKQSDGFADVMGNEGPAQFSSAQAPAGCYPRDQLTPSELLPKDMNSVWSEQNPMGPGSLKGKNFLSAGALIGVNTVGQSMRNANLQVRSEPPNPQVAVSIFNQSTISPDSSHRPLEIGA